MNLLMSITILANIFAASSSVVSTATLYDVSFVPTQTPTATLPPLPVNSVHDEFSASFSAINPSPGSDVTTYQVEVIRSLVWLYNPVKSQTYTILTTPTTIDYTRIEGASMLQVTIPAPSSTPTTLPDGSRFSFGGSIENCTFDRDTQHGVCIKEAINPVIAKTTQTINGQETLVETLLTQTFTATISGTLVPVGTATLSNGVATSQANLLTVSCLITILAISIGILTE